jgi:hypothetical protein
MTKMADGQLDQYLYAIAFVMARRQMRQRWAVDLRKNHTSLRIALNAP